MIPFMKDNLHTHITQEIIDNKDRVICDVCNKEFTDADTESGGFLFGSSYAYCPACATECLPVIEGYRETHFIKAWCPPELSYRRWVLDVLRQGNNLTTITTMERKEQ